MANTRSGAPVLIWHGFCSKVELSAHDKLQILRLLQGERATLGYEKLKGVKIYSIRGSDERRILFTTRTIQGKAYLFVLEILPTHNYHTAKSLKKGVVEKFFETHQASINKAFENGQIDIEPNPADVAITPSADENTDFEFIDLDYFNEQFITLNDEQQHVKSTHHLPLIVSGPAGSGKTTVALSFLIDLVSDLNDRGETLTLPILVVSDKPKLKLETEKQWYNPNNPLSLTPAGQMVRFLTDEAVVATYSNAGDLGLTPIPTQELPESIFTFVKKEMGLTHPFPITALRSILLHEFEIIAACKNEKEYLALGERESNLRGDHQTHRPFLWRSAQRYFKQLATEGRYSYRFFQWKIDQPQCYMIIADEAHTSSLVAKSMQRRMVADGRFIAFVHSAQTTDKEMSHVPSMIKNLGKDGKPTNVHQLKLCYRNPACIIRFANTVTRLRRFAAGGLTDKTEELKMIADETNGIKEGRIEWVYTHQLKDFRTRTNTTHKNIIIVTQAAFVKEAIANFNTGLVFTPDEIGGLEFDEVIIYRLTETDKLGEINKKLQNYQPDSKDKTHLPKSKQKEEAHQQFFSGLYTAATRAKKSLTIMEVKPKNKNTLHEHLKAAIDPPTPAQELNTTPVIETTPLEWEQQIIDLIQQNLIARAKQAWVVNLKRDETSFDAFKALHTVPPIPAPSIPIPQKLAKHRDALFGGQSLKLQIPNSLIDHMRQIENHPPTVLNVFTIPDENIRTLYQHYKTTSADILNDFADIDLNQVVMTRHGTGSHLATLIKIDAIQPGIFELIMMALGKKCYEGPHPLRMNTLTTLVTIQENKPRVPLLTHIANQWPPVAGELIRHCRGDDFKSIDPAFWTRNFPSANQESVLIALLRYQGANHLVHLISLLTKENNWVITHQPFTYWLSTDVILLNKKIDKEDREAPLELLHSESGLVLALVKKVMDAYSDEVIDAAFSNKLSILSDIASFHYTNQPIIKYFISRLKPKLKECFVDAVNHEIKLEIGARSFNYAFNKVNTIEGLINAKDPGLALMSSLSNTQSLSHWLAVQTNGYNLFINVLMHPSLIDYLLADRENLLNPTKRESIADRNLELLFNVYCETDPKGELMITTNGHSHPFLFWLFDEPNRRAMFLTLYHHAPKLFFKSAHFSNLTTPFYSQELHYELPLLSYMVNSQFGFAVTSLFRNYPVALKHMAPILLNTYGDDKYKTTPIFDYYFFDPDKYGKPDLIDLLTANKQLILKSITLEDWFLPRVGLTTTKIMSSYLQILHTTYGKIKLITDLFSHWHTKLGNKLFTYFSADFLFERMCLLNGTLTSSLFFDLSAKDEAMDLLDTFMTHATYSDAAMANALLTSYGPNEDIPTMTCNWNALAHLISSPIRVLVLIKLFNARPGVLKELMSQPQAWSSPPHITPIKHDALLREMTKHKAGLAFFQQVKNDYPDLLKRAHASADREHAELTNRVNNRAFTLYPPPPADAMPEAPQKPSHRPS